VPTRRGRTIVNHDCKAPIVAVDGRNRIIKVGFDSVTRTKNSFPNASDGAKVTV
jgi:hypothetical protein